MTNQNGGKTPVGVIVAIVLAAIVALCTFSLPKQDVVHDPDGFLGYSDSFWEWQAKQ